VTLPAIFSNRFAHMAFAFFGMGAWAVFANRMHGAPAALLAGVVQGCISATITLLLQREIDALRRFGQWIAILAACATSLAILLVIHTLAATPELWTTIALPWGIGCSYVLLYTLRRQP